MSISFASCWTPEGGWAYALPRPTSTTCSRCDVSGELFWCGRCHSVKYCGAVCQKKDRGKHKGACFGRPSESVSLGCGLLGWDAEARKSDKYDVVILSTATRDVTLVQPQPPVPGESCIGVLTATVLETHPPTHLGDVHHRVAPTIPAVGERIVLGAGKYAQVARITGPHAAVQPLDGRALFWMDIRALYRANGNLVELFWEPYSLGAAVPWTAEGAQAAFTYVQKGASKPPTAVER